MTVEVQPELATLRCRRKRASARELNALSATKLEAARMTGAGGGTTLAYWYHKPQRATAVRSLHTFIFLPHALASEPALSMSHATKKGLMSH